MFYLSETVKPGKNWMTMDRLYVLREPRSCLGCQQCRLMGVDVRLSAKFDVEDRFQLPCAPWNLYLWRVGGGFRLSFLISLNVSMLVCSLRLCFGWSGMEDLGSFVVVAVAFSFSLLWRIWQSGLTLIHLFPQVSSCLFIPSLLASWWAGWRLSFICPVFIVYCCWLEESKYAAPLVCLLSFASWCFCSCNASRWTMLPQWVWVYAGVSRIYFMWEVFIEWLVECGWQL